MIPVSKSYMIKRGICDAVDVDMSGALSLDCLSVTMIGRVDCRQMDWDGVIVVITAKSNFLPIPMLIDLALSNAPKVSKS
jgi:hypothetical protein